jgi:ribosomal protein S21
MAKIIRKPNESTDSMISRFKRQVAKDGTLKELKSHEYYVSPSQKRRLKHIEALKKIMKKSG